MSGQQPYLPTLRPAVSPQFQSMVVLRPTLTAPLSTNAAWSSYQPFGTAQPQSTGTGIFTNPSGVFAVRSQVSSVQAPVTNSRPRPIFFSPPQLPVTATSSNQIGALHAGPTVQAPGGNGVRFATTTQIMLPAVQILKRPHSVAFSTAAFGNHPQFVQPANNISPPKIFRLAAPLTSPNFVTQPPRSIFTTSSQPIPALQQQHLAVPGVIPTLFQPKRHLTPAAVGAPPLVMIRTSQPGSQAGLQPPARFSPLVRLNGQLYQAQTPLPTNNFMQPSPGLSGMSMAMASPGAASPCRFVLPSPAVSLAGGGQTFVRAAVPRVMSIAPWPVTALKKSSGVAAAFHPKETIRPLHTPLFDPKSDPTAAFLARVNSHHSANSSALGRAKQQPVNVRSRADGARTVQAIRPELLGIVPDSRKLPTEITVTLPIPSEDAELSIGR